MTEITADEANAEQVEFWNGEAGQEWVERDRQMRSTLRPIGGEAIAAALVQSGEAVLDVGCGCADTSFALLDSVGAAGRVLGVDISGPMLGSARSRAKQLSDELQSAIDFEHADASIYPFEAASFDLVFSRFGVMFFADPAAAFANIRKALKPKGRIAFICWAPVPENEWITLPMSAAFQHVPRPEPMPPNSPGPFGLSDREFTEQMLVDAGYTDINIVSTRPLMRFGHGIEQDRVADFFIDIGPVSRVLKETPPDLQETVRLAIADVIMPHYDGETVNLNASCWIVTASNTG